MQIDLKVKHQRILGVQQIPRLVIEKTTGFVYLNLEFDDEWDGCNIIVLLTNDRQSGNPVQYTWNGEPIEVAPELLVTGTLRVSCVGLETDDQGETVQRLTTKRMSEGVRIHRAGDQTGVEPGTTVPGLWEQAMSTMGPLQMLETENKANMVAAINEIKRVAEIKPNVEIGEVETGEEGTEAQVTNTGVYPDVKLNFVIPPGATGKSGTSPHIGKNGNWWLGGQDTGVVAEAPTVDVETDWAAMGNQLVPMYRLIITQPDGTKKTIAWTDGAEGQPGQNAGAYYPVLSEDGVLSFQYVGYMQPLPEEWVPTKIIGGPGVGIERIEFKETTQAGNVYTVFLSDNTSYEIIAPRGPQGTGGGGSGGEGGAEGVGIWLIQLKEEAETGNTYTVFLTDGSSYDFVAPAGPAGKAGKDGSDGSNGKDGTSVTVSSVSESTADGGTNVVTFSDGKKLNVKNGSTGSAGKDGSNGKDGTSVTVAGVSESTVDGGTNVVTFSDGKKLNVKNGSKGSKGDSPVKGTDYFTEADKQEIAQAAAALVEVPDGFSGSWNDLADKPSTFTPAAHNQAASTINSGTFDAARIPNLAASKITAGTFAGQVVANSSGQAVANYVVRNSKISASAETPTVNGQICWKYK